MKKKQKKPEGILATAASALRRKRTVSAVYILLRFLVILTMVAQFSTGTMRASSCACSPFCFCCCPPSWSGR